MLIFYSYSVYASQSPVDDWNEQHCRKKSPCPSSMLKQDELAFNPLGSNIELRSTVRSLAQGPMSSSARHVILLCFLSFSRSSCHLLRGVWTPWWLSWSFPQAIEGVTLMPVYNVVIKRMSYATFAAIISWFCAAVCVWAAEVLLASYTVVLSMVNIINCQWMKML